MATADGGLAKSFDNMRLDQQRQESFDMTTTADSSSLPEPLVVGESEDPMALPVASVPAVDAASSHERGEGQTGLTLPPRLAPFSPDKWPSCRVEHMYTAIGPTLGRVVKYDNLKGTGLLLRVDTQTPVVFSKNVILSHGEPIVNNYDYVAMWLKGDYDKQYAARITTVDYKYLPSSERSPPKKQRGHSIDNVTKWADSGLAYRRAGNGTAGVETTTKDATADSQQDASEDATPYTKEPVNYRKTFADSTEHLVQWTQENTTTTEAGRHDSRRGPRHRRRCTDNRGHRRGNRRSESNNQPQPSANGHHPVTNGYGAGVATFANFATQATGFAQAYPALEGQHQLMECGSPACVSALQPADLAGNMLLMLTNADATAQTATYAPVSIPATVQYVSAASYPPESLMQPLTNFTQQAQLYTVTDAYPATTMLPSLMGPGTPSGALQPYANIQTAAPQQVFCNYIA